MSSEYFDKWEKEHCALCQKEFSNDNSYHLEKAPYGVLRVCERCREKRIKELIAKSSLKEGGI